MSGPRKRAAGFSLVELVVLLSVVGIMMALTAVSVCGYYRRAAAERAAQLFAQDLDLARSRASRNRRAVVIRFYEGSLRYEVEDQATGTDLVVRRFGTNADIDFTGVTLEFTGDSVVFNPRGIADLSGALGALGTATFSSGAETYTVSFNSMGASKID